MKVREISGLSMILIVCLLALISSCQKPVVIPEGEEIVARVDDAVLYQSDLLQIIHPNMGSQDSLSLATAYIDQWVREQLLTIQAEKYFSDNPEIDRLVNDYRGKLQGIRLEEKVLTERYDTVISNQELKAYYETMQSQFMLHDDLYRGVYIKIKRGQDGITDFRKSWNNGQLKDIHSFASAFAEEYHSDTTLWRTWDDMGQWYSKWSLTKANSLQSQTQRDQEYEYFLKIVDREAKGEVSPFTYVADRLKKMLLHKKKGEVLEHYKQELYERALNNNMINIR